MEKKRRVGLFNVSSVSEPILLSHRSIRAIKATMTAAKARRAILSPSTLVTFNYSQYSESLVCMPAGASQSFATSLSRGGEYSVARRTRYRRFAISRRRARGVSVRAAATILAVRPFQFSAVSVFGSSCSDGDATRVEME